MLFGSVPPCPPPLWLKLLIPPEEDEEDPFAPPADPPLCLLPEADEDSAEDVERAELR